MLIIRTSDMLPKYLLHGRYSTIATIEVMNGRDAVGKDG